MFDFLRRFKPKSPEEEQAALRVVEGTVSREGYEIIPNSEQSVKVFSLEGDRRLFRARNWDHHVAFIQAGDRVRLWVHEDNFVEFFENYTFGKERGETVCHRVGWAWPKG